MKRYIVGFVGESDSIFFDETFATKAGAEKFIDRQVKNESPKDYARDTSWNYLIFELVSVYDVAVKVSHNITCTKREKK